jgi:hypothetical protein
MRNENVTELTFHISRIYTNPTNWPLLEIRAVDDQISSVKVSRSALWIKENRNDDNVHACIKASVCA